MKNSISLKCKLALVSVMFFLTSSNVLSQWTRTPVIPTTNPSKVFVTNVLDKVGIGTNSPTSKLDLQKGDMSINDGNILLRNGADYNHSLGWYGTGKLFAGQALNGPALIGWDGGVLGYSNGNGPQNISLRWNGAGNVGIGTVSPVAKLHINSIGAYSFGLLVTGNDPHVKSISVNDQTGTNNFLVYANGEVFAREVTVKLGNFPDYVFEKNYKLRSIDDLSNYISKNSHLPNIPSAEEVKNNNIGIGELQVKLLEKVEELTLYIIQLNERVKTLEVENAKLKDSKN